MTNWFYMDRHALEVLLYDELGANLAPLLISIGFDTPVSFMIGETSNEILLKIQQTFSRHLCRKLICSDQCLSCSLTPPNYAKLAWFVQRLLIMSPLSKPFIKQTTSEKLSNENSTCAQSKNSPTNDSIDCKFFLFILWIGIIGLIFITKLL